MTQLVIHRTGDSRTDATLYPPVTGTAHRIPSHDGTELACLVAGDGPPLVLAHGSLVSSASWALMWRPLLDAGYRLIAYDLRGHGLSTLGSDGFGTGPYGRDLAPVLEHFDVRDGVTRMVRLVGCQPSMLDGAVGAVVPYRARRRELPVTNVDARRLDAAGRVREQRVGDRWPVGPEGVDAREPHACRLRVGGDAPADAALSSIAVEQRRGERLGVGA
jgi:alpha/beta hydrolase fold